MTRYYTAITLIILVSLAVAPPASAQPPLTVVPPPERLCDTQYEDCREPILNLIRNEQMGIDVGFWYMQDSRYATELINRFNAGVPVRILVDTRANATYLGNPAILQQLSSAGIPMREKFGEDILHNKMMLFHGQNMVEFSKANFDPFAYVPEQIGTNYEDEAVYFTNDDRLTNSFRRRFDDRWVDTTLFRNYANITGPLVRSYPLLPIDPSMNFSSASGDFSARLISRMDRETQSIDAIVFRVTEDRMADAANRAVARGVPVRLITEPGEYRNIKRLYDSKEVDRMYMGGVQVKIRQHQGITHEALVVLHALGEVVFGSANWTLASAVYQDEHNFFYNPTLGKPWFFSWFVEQFNDKWNDATNFVPFRPLPPDPPTYSAPGNGVSGVGSSVTLKWDGGPWSHMYDIYFGTASDPPLLTGNIQLGAPDPGVIETYTISNLLPGTTYYWRIVDRTWARQINSGLTWSFTTAGTPPNGGGTSPFGGTPAAVPGTIQAENFDEGGQNIAYFDTSAGNKGAAYRSTDVDIQPTTDTGGGYNLGWTKAGEWVKYTVNVATTGTYTLETRLSQLGTGGSFHVEVDGVDGTGAIAVPDTGSWDTWQTVTTPGIPLSAGVRVLRVAFDSVGSGGGVANFNWFRLTTTSAPPPPPPPPGNTPFGGTPWAIPGLFQAENFDDGGQNVAYFDTAAGNKGGVYRDTDVDLQPTTDVGGGFNIGWTKAGEWVKYTVNVSTSGTYTFESRISNVGVGSFHLEVDGVNRSGAIAVPDTGAWDSWQTIATPGIPLTAGQHVLRVVFDTMGAGGAVGNFNWFRLSTP